MATSHMNRASCHMLEINEFRCYEVKIEKKLAVTVSQTEDTSGLSDQKKKKKKKVQGSPVHNPVYSSIIQSII